jgi:peptidoglycan/LPS O-acetylase OafA/YrhL
MASVPSGHALIGPGAFRLFLALLVFVSHTSRLKVGTTAVLVFLMLSGYWVSRIYLAGRYQGAGPFLIGRLLRLWPIVITCTLVAAGLQLAVGDRLIGSFWSTIFFLGIASRRNDVIGTTWSLDIELQFYILLPLLIAGLLLAGPRWRPWLVAGMLAATVAGVLLVKVGAVTALVFAPVFAAGIWLQLSQWQPGRAFALGSLALFLAVLGFYALRIAPRPDELAAVQVYHITLFNLAVAACAIPFVAWNVHVRTGTFDRWLGDLSYPFYLLHFPVIWATTSLWGDSLLVKGAALVISAALTILLNRYLDQPIEAWRRRTLTARNQTA